MNKHRSSERNTPLALTIGLLLIISVFAMSSCSKKKANESQESSPTLADSSVTTAENTDETGTTSLTDGSSDASGESTDSSSASDTEEPTESFTDSALFNPSDSDSTAPSGAETTPGTGSTDTPSGNPTKAPKATATPKPKATATPKPKATATPAPKENTPTPVPKENTPTPKPQPKPSGDASNYGAQEMLDKINAKRAEKGLSALSLNDTLNKGCRIRAEELAREYGHDRPDGKGKGKYIVKELGLSYSYVAECIGAGQSSVSEIFDMWMASSGHSEKILSSSCTSMGLGYIKVSNDAQGYTYYWVLLLMG